MAERSSSLLALAPKLRDRIVKCFQPSSIVKKYSAGRPLLLRRYIGLGDSPGSRPPDDAPAYNVWFFIERAPSSRVGAACKLPSCTERIWPGEYRLALNPGKSGSAWVRASNANSGERFKEESSALMFLVANFHGCIPDIYHISCFEKIADFTQSDYDQQLFMVTRASFPLRGINAMSILDREYLLGGCAERLILKWRVRRGEKIGDRHGVDQCEAMAPALDGLLQRAGSWTYQHEPVPRIAEHEDFLLRFMLAPIESAGEGDTQEWSLFDEFLHDAENEEGLLDRHSLSKMLNRWAFHKKLVLSDEAIPTKDDQQYRRNLDKEAVKAISRLSGIPMPDTRRAFFWLRDIGFGSKNE